MELGNAHPKSFENTKLSSPKHVDMAGAEMQHAATFAGDFE